MGVWCGSGYGDVLEKDLAKAVEWYLVAAEKGHGGAEQNLGECYLNGLGVEMNMNVAISWFKRASEKGRLGAMFSLASIYEAENNGVEAVRWFSRAAELGDLRSKHKLSSYYEKGICVTKDPEKAFQLLMEACAIWEDYPEIMTDLGAFYEMRQRWQEAINAYHQAANQGDMTALYNLGAIHSKGLGVDSNWELAWDYFVKASELGDSDAMYQCGRALAKGCVTKSNKTAAEWFKGAMEGFKRNIEEFSCHHSCLMMAKMLIKGKYVDQDEEKGLEYLHKSIEGDYAEAQGLLFMGELHAKGTRLVEENAALSFEYVQRAAEMDLGDAQLCLANYYNDGFGCERNDSEFMKYLSKAAAHGVRDAIIVAAPILIMSEKHEIEGMALLRKHVDGKDDPEARFMFGCYLLDGKKIDETSGLVETKLLGVTYLVKAAEKRHGRALERLGMCFLKGEGVEINTIVAYGLFERAWTLCGVASAALMTGKMYASGVGVGLEMDKAVACYNVASKAGNHEATLLLANCYECGKGCPLDMGMAFKLYLQAANGSNSAIAQWKLGMFYMAGVADVVEPNPAAAITFFIRAAEQDSRDAITELVNYYSKANDAESFSFWKNKLEGLNSPSKKQKK